MLKPVELYLRIGEETENRQTSCVLPIRINARAAVELLVRVGGTKIAYGTRLLEHNRDGNSYL